MQVLLLLLAVMSLTSGTSLLPKAQLTKAMRSRHNDSKRQPFKYYSANHDRCRYILSAFYLHCNMHSEVYSLFESLLDEMQQWMQKQEGQGGISMNQLEELMMIARKAADEFETISDYRKRAGQGRILESDDRLSMIAVVPAVIATLNIPQRTELTRQLCTISPRQCPLIEQFTDYVRRFAGKPWKPSEEKRFGKVNEGPLEDVIKELIERAKLGDIQCITKPSYDDVDQVAQGMEAALMASLFNGPCTTNLKDQFTTAQIKTFTKWACQLRVPRVSLEAARPLQAVRHELLHFLKTIPSQHRVLVKAVTRALNEKRPVEEIGRMVQEYSSDDSEEAELMKPIILAPLAFISSLDQVLQLPVMKDTFAYKLLVSIAFSAIQSGDDYYKLAEQVDHQQHMQRRTDTLLSNNLSAYLQIDLKPPSDRYKKVIERQCRKGFKALAWNLALRENAGMIAQVSRSFPDTPAENVEPFMEDYWHALVRYTLPARTPFHKPPAPARIDLGKELSRAQDCLPPLDYALYTTHQLLQHSTDTVSDGDLQVGLVLALTALLCKNKECNTLQNKKQVLELAVMNPRDAWTVIKSRPDLVNNVKSRLSIPNINCSVNSVSKFKLHEIPLESTTSPNSLYTIITDTLNRTKRHSVSDYMWSCTLLLHDVIANRLPRSFLSGESMNVATLISFIHSNNRDQIIVSLLRREDLAAVLTPHDLHFINSNQVNLVLPEYAVEQARSGPYVLPDQARFGQSRLLKKIQEALSVQSGRVSNP